MFATPYFIELLVALDPQVRNAQNFSLKRLGVLEVCLELLSNLKDQFSFVIDKFSEFVHSRKSSFSPHF